MNIAEALLARLLKIVAEEQEDILLPNEEMNKDCCGFVYTKTQVHVQIQKGGRNTVTVHENEDGWCMITCGWEPVYSGQITGVVARVVSRKMEEKTLMQRDLLELQQTEKQTRRRNDARKRRLNDEND